MSAFSPFEPDGAGLPAERILTLSDITLLVLCCMLALNFLLVPLLDFTQTLEIDLPRLEGGEAAPAPTTIQGETNPVIIAQLSDPAAGSVEERLTLAVDGRPVALSMLARRLRQGTPPTANHIEFRGDAALTTQDLVEVLMAVEESGLELPGGVQIHVEISPVTDRIPQSTGGTI
jgi:biopolymer transport protein ExbD